MNGISRSKSTQYGTYQGGNEQGTTERGSVNDGGMVLELDHISKIYGDVHAVDDLSLTVPQGEWLAIVGSSGRVKPR